MTTSAVVRVRVPAKINLALCVGPRADDGFHPLGTVFEAVNLFDEVLLWPADEVNLNIVGEGVDAVPVGPENLAAKAFALLAARYTLPAPGVHLEIRKSIPVAGGMAGGSADAAATLLAVNEWAGLGMDAEELRSHAAELGSDVPFALLGGVALGTGRGDHVMPIMQRGHHHWVLAFSEGGLSTPAVYGRFDELVPDGRDVDVPDAMIDALAAGDVEHLASTLRNDLQEAALDLRPDLQKILDAGQRAGALAGIVSGSGPTCAFLCRNEDAAVQVSAALVAEPGIVGVRRVHGPVPGARIIREHA